MTSNVERLATGGYFTEIEMSFRNLTGTPSSIAGL